jgi:hypothetical protein
MTLTFKQKLILTPLILLALMGLDVLRTLWFFGF